jgi:hypothetical protein
MFYVRLPEFDPGQSYVCEAPDLPYYEVETVEQRQQLVKRKYPSGLALADLSIKFYEDHEGSVFAYVRKWFDQIVDVHQGSEANNGAVAMPSAWLKTICVEVLRLDNTPCRTYKYDGYPVKISGYDFSTEDGLVQPTVRFRVNTVSFEGEEVGTPTTPADLGQFL